MPSQALVTWRGPAARALDQIEAAHAAVGGAGPGRRYATQQINQAYAVMLSSQFQRFCRDIHSEAADHLAAAVTNPDLRVIFRTQITSGRKLDTGNPNPANLGSDFGRLRMDFWSAVRGQDPRNLGRQARLERLNRWRNAIAHQDFDPAQLGGSELRLATVRNWRGACNALASEFDHVIRSHLATILGTAPW